VASGENAGSTGKDSEKSHPSDGRKVSVLISEERLAARVREIGAQIRADIGPGEITLLSILKGSFIFAADLCRAIPGPVNIEFLGVSSYGDDTQSSGAVRITHDLQKPIADRHVIIVEDIVDTGLTLAYLKRVLTARHPASLRICALLEKPHAGSPVKPDYAGFEVGDEFVVGYGLDFAQRLRNLPYVGVVDVS
jgi:hypoxanthine phosphoribosyltransferase